MSKIKNGGLDQYGAERSKQQQFGTAGVEGVKHSHILLYCYDTQLLTTDFNGQKTKLAYQEHRAVNSGHWTVYICDQGRSFRSSAERQWDVLLARERETQS